MIYRQVLGIALWQEDDEAAEAAASFAGSGACSVAMEQQRWEQHMARSRGHACGGRS